MYFEAGCRNSWHAHPSNQILLVGEGICWYKQEGGPLQGIPAGQAINIYPGIRHWHGASPEAPMMHTAINLDTDKGTVQWMEPESEQQYRGH